MAEPATNPAQDASPKDSDRRRFLRYVMVLLLVGAVMLAWASLLSFSPADPPSPSVYPHAQPVNNAVGVLGAYLAYTLTYWLGAGAYVGLALVSLAALLLVLGGRITLWPWRAGGVILVTLTTSAAFHLGDPLCPDGPMDSAAGVLGMAMGWFLRTRFGLTGGWIVLAVVMLIGLLFVGDNILRSLPEFGRKMQAHWQGLRDRVAAWRAERAAPALADGATPAARTATAAPARPKPIAQPKPNPPAASPAPTPAAAPAPAPAPRTEKPARVESSSRNEASTKKEQNRKKSAPPAATNRFELPTVEGLIEPTGGYGDVQEEQAREKLNVLQQTLQNFNVDAQVVGYMTGPVITLFEVAVAPGVKVAQVANLAQDIARALAVPAVRVFSPIPGKDTIGIEVPNLEKETVRIKELMDLAPEEEGKMALPLYLGKDAGGQSIVQDLAGMPHCLIAGTTGSGKSVCINAIVMSLLMCRTPEQVRFILVDPKMVEMAMYENIPHLLCPIVNDMRRAEAMLEWAATKMDERYELLKEAGVRNIAGYNRLGAEEVYRRFGATEDDEKARIPTTIPYYVIIIDELADLMMVSSKEVETHIIRIAQKARAVGIHLVLATQRPSVNVVTGLIKSNMPCRISFKVATRQESRIVLDQNGAEVLLGRGDMLLLPPGTSNLVRSQGTFVDDSEIHAIVDQLRALGEPQYNTELVRINSGAIDAGGGQKDDLFDQAVEIVLRNGRGSVTLLQRKLQIGYGRAARIVEQMAEAGIVGDHKGSQARECLLTLEDWQELKESIRRDQSGESAADGEPTSA